MATELCNGENVKQSLLYFTGLYYLPKAKSVLIFHRALKNSSTAVIGAVSDGDIPQISEGIYHPREPHVTWGPGIRIVCDH